MRAQKHSNACDVQEVVGQGGSPLSELSVGERGFVVSVEGSDEIRRRLMEMGFCNGAAVAVVRRAPLGDPIEYRLRGYHISLRHGEACMVRVARSRPCRFQGINV